MPTLEMSRDEIVAEMERVAQARLGMSAADVVAAYRAGVLENPGQVGDVLVLAGLLDPSDPYFAD